VRLEHQVATVGRLQLPATRALVDLASVELERS
jgi:hypothetical protein